MDWLSPVNAGAPSALALKEGDRVFCRYCDRPLFSMSRTPANGEEGWESAIKVDEGAVNRLLDIGYSVKVLCAGCKEAALVDHPNVADAPLEMRPKD